MRRDALGERAGLDDGGVDMPRRRAVLGLRRRACVGFDGDDRLGHPRQHRGRIAVAAADVESEVRRPDVQRVEELGEDPRVERTRPGRAARARRDRRRTQPFGDEMLAWTASMAAMIG